MPKLTLWDKRGQSAARARFEAHARVLPLGFWSLTLQVPTITPHRRPFVFVAMVLMLAGCDAPKGSATTRRQVTIAGSVVDGATKQPVSAAQILIDTQTDSAVAFTNQDGVFAALITQQGDSRGPAALRVRAHTFKPLSRQVAIDSIQVVISQLLLESEAKTTGLDAPIEKVFRSGPRLSGFAAEWSEHQICPDPPPAGYEIASTSFHLEGDRTCGSWAQCEAVGTCWRFRLQGHNEFPPRAAVSEGVLKVLYKPIRVQPRAIKGTVYIQYRSPWQLAHVDEIRAYLESEGFGCPMPEEVRASTKNSVRYFRPDDREIAEAVRLLLVRRMFTSFSRPINAVVSDFSSQFNVKSPQLELWLGPE